MAVEEITAYDDNDNNNNNNNMSLSLPNIDDERFSDWESPLCVPQDSLEDIDWFPNFTDEIISLNGFFRTWDDDDDSIVIDRTVSFANKKQRSKRGGKRGCSNMKKQNNSNELQVFDNITERRMCSHCNVENTPQWRMGPLGPKTLCNACGVRYKSGRLVPEYRPAASPTFDLAKHSNFHKKILRRRDFSSECTRFD